MDIIILSLIAITPPIAFLWYILYLDKHEPEPIGYIIKIMIFGGLTVIPAAGIELAIGTIPLFQTTGLEGAILKSFIMIAPVEELVKISIILLFVWNNENFNEENDGIVYTGTVAIGFALLENIVYVIQNGVSTGILRALTAIPLHTFTGVLMGYYIGIAKFAPSKKDTKKYILLGFFIAYLIHAVYDTFALSGTSIAALLFPLVFGLFVFGVIYLKKGQKLSSQRWQGQPVTAKDEISSESQIQEETKPSECEPPIEKHGKVHKWKAIVGRTLLSMSILIWITLISEIFTTTDQNYPVEELIGGTIILTFIPIGIGILLEISFRREKKNQA